MAARLSSLETLTRSSQEIAERYLMPARMLRRQLQRQQGPTAATSSSGAQNSAMQDPGMQVPVMPEMPDSPPGTRYGVAREVRSREQREAARAARTVMTDLVDQKVLRAAYSERQLEEIMVDFWFNHFNVFAGKAATRVYLTAYERDAIRPHALGRFRDLLQATAESPAMLFFLDNWQSSTPDAAGLRARQNIDGVRRPNAGRVGARRTASALPDGTGGSPAESRALPPRPRGINENYARELMELHTLGVDGGYTQQDVREVARAFTGWTIRNPRAGGGFAFQPRMHDDGEKVVLGQRISGGGKRDGEQVLDILAKHPVTATFIATKLARRFVSDDPPPSLVQRAAGRFRESDGGIRETVRLIITSPEFFAPDAYRAKVKTPFEFVVSAVRATGVEIGTGLPLATALRELGMPLYMCQPPTGYADRADAWVNTGALLGRMNFAVSLTTGRLLSGGAVRGSASQVSVTTLVESVLGGDLSEQTKGTIARAEQASQGLALLLGSPEFQKK
jgi:uncharacterized protein (DUF1800 family)